MTPLDTATAVDRKSIDRKDLFLRACRGETLSRVPVWMMRQAGRYLPEYREIRAHRPFLEVCKTPDLAAEVSLQPFRILGVDAIIVFSDILIPAEAMGLALELNDAGPNLPNPVRNAADVNNLRMFDPEVETKFLPEAKGGERTDGRDLVLEMRRNGFEIVRTKAELESIPRWRRPDRGQAGRDGVRGPPAGAMSKRRKAPGECRAACRPCASPRGG